MSLEESRKRFRREIGKLDNWIYHKRIFEYFKEKKPIKEMGPDGQA
ncbi:hypothetical protein MUO93_03095 [Candidatus Bathyarchaeota archaeon]|nr:hypothetical protein [Candidatus Bathyarchaeota archaeon]